MRQRLAQRPRDTHAWDAIEPLVSQIQEGRFARIKILFAGVDRRSRDEAIRKLEDAQGGDKKLEIEIESSNEESRIARKLGEKSYDIIFINGSGKKIKGNRQIPRTTQDIIKGNAQRIKDKSPSAKVVAIHNKHNFELETKLRAEFGISQHITKRDMLNCSTFGELATTLMKEVLEQKIKADALKEIIEIIPFGEVKKRGEVVRGVFDKLASREREAKSAEEVDGRVSVYDAHMVETGHFTAIVHAITLMAEYIQVGNLIDLGSGTTKPVGRIVRELLAPRIQHGDVGELNIFNVDISEEMLRVGARKYAARKRRISELEKMKVYNLLGDLSELKGEDLIRAGLDPNKPTTIFASYIVHWKGMRETVELLRRISRELGKECPLRIITIDEMDPKGAQVFTDSRYVQKHPGMFADMKAHIGRVDIGEYHAELEKSGFEKLFAPDPVLITENPRHHIFGAAWKVRE
jgi:SAM-dependent methyltransferase